LLHQDLMRVKHCKTINRPFGNGLHHLWWFGGWFIVLPCFTHITLNMHLNKYASNITHITHIYTI
jgi:hypothetical protein